MPPDTLKPILDHAAARLKAAGCGTPELDARLLLQHVTGLTRADMILDPDRVIAPDAVIRFLSLVKRREAREPVSRILGEREFYGRSFRVTPDVLDPRPDTETLVEAALAAMPHNSRILDLGTGSGAIIITLLAERPDTSGVAVDDSAAALAVASGNAERLGVGNRLACHQGSWFEGIDGRFDLIVSNPPYIPAGDIPGLSPDVKHFDPLLALAGGVDGLDPYRAIAAGATTHLEPEGLILLEIGAGQAEDVEAIFMAGGLRALSRHRDLGGHVRCLAFGLDQKLSTNPQVSKKPIGN